MCIEIPYRYPRSFVPLSDRSWNREEVKNWFENEVFGAIDENCRKKFSFSLQTEKKLPCAVKKTIIVQCGDFSAPFYLFLPKRAKPSLLIHPILSSYRNVFDLDDPTNYIREKSRSSFPVSFLLEKGFAVACYYVDDVALDEQGGDNTKIMPYLNTVKSENSAGVLCAWAFFASLIIDYATNENLVNGQKIGIAGHSRGGKTALVAGAFDERIGFVLSNNAGCAGNAISVSTKGETIYDITTRFPYWFCKNFLAYGQNKTILYDFDSLLALIAPRYLYVTSSSKDKWAYPKNEYLGCLSASFIFEKYGKKGMIAENPPRLNTPYQEGCIAYHVKKGKHSLSFYDWQQAVDFLLQNHFEK